MIATCPHCQSGFYISSELAGAVIKCSKCKKEVRAPDRRGCAPGPLSQADDGIPVAILAETRAEAEEHLKNETEARFELEKKIKDALDARAKAEFQSKIDSQAREDAEERLKQEVSARAAIEAKLFTEIDARKKAEELAMDHDDLEEKLKAENEARLKSDVYAETLGMELAEVKAKLKETDEVRTESEKRAASEAEAKAKLEQLLQAETDVRIKAESQAKAEAIAKKKYQSQAESETALRIKLEQELEAAKTKIHEAKVTASEQKPIDITKGLVRLTFILSFVMAFAGGYIAYINGNIIRCRYDRPIHLSWLNDPVYIPRLLAIIAFGIGGCLIAWAAFLLAIFIIKGFGRSGSAKIKPVAQPEPMAEQTYSAGEVRMWRSS